MLVQGSAGGGGAELPEAGGSKVSSARVPSAPFFPARVPPPVRASLESWGFHAGSPAPTPYSRPDHQARSLSARRSTPCRSRALVCVAGVVESAPPPPPPPKPSPRVWVTLNDVAARHTQLALVYNAQVLRENNSAYEAHMLKRPSSVDLASFEPSAVLGDELMSLAAGTIAAALGGRDVSRLGAVQRSSLATNMQAAITAALTSLLGAPPPAPAASAPAGSSSPSSLDPYARLAFASTGEAGLSERRIAQKRRDDSRRGGQKFVRFFTGGRRDTGATDCKGKAISDEGKAAHEAVAALMSEEAERRSEATAEERLAAYREVKVAHAGKAEAVIGKDGLVNGKGEARRYSRSFVFSIVRDEKYGAVTRSIGSDDEEAAKTGPIGDEWTLDEVDALLDDERVPETLKALLRLSDAMLVESELAEGELILGYRTEPVIVIKAVGTPVAPVPLTPIWAGWAMAGAACSATFDFPDSHLTRTGYRHVTYRLLSFAFDICDCAMTPCADWSFMPTSLQSGGDNRILDADRFGELVAHGAKGGANGGAKGDVAPPRAPPAPLPPPSPPSAPPWATPTARVDTTPDTLHAPPEPARACASFRA